jgi:hypothetical protein
MSTKSCAKWFEQKGHDIKRCCTVSKESQKQHFWQLFQLRLARLSFASNTLLLKNYIKIFIISFQRYLRKNLLWPFINSRYIDFTIKIPKSVSVHTNLSGSFESWTINSCWHKCIHWFHLWSFNAIFRGVWARTSATRTFFRCTMLYKNGYCCAREVSPNQISSQNHTKQPSPTLKEPLLKKIIFYTHDPFPKEWIGRFYL